MISSPMPRALGHVSPAQVRGLHWSQGTADPAVNKVATVRQRCGLCPHPTPRRQDGETCAKLGGSGGHSFPVRGDRSQNASRRCWDSAGGGGGIISCH